MANTGFTHMEEPAHLHSLERPARAIAATRGLRWLLVVNLPGKMAEAKSRGSAGLREEEDLFTSKIALFRARQEGGITDHQKLRSSALTSE